MVVRIGELGADSNQPSAIHNGGKARLVMTKVFIGVDPHKLSATIEVVDDRERVLATGRFTTDKAGYAAMRRHVAAWPQRTWAVEGSNGAGRPLAPRLLAVGEHVIDVPAKLSARARLFDTGDNRRTDAHDAHSVAVVAVRTRGLRALSYDSELEALRMLGRFHQIAEASFRRSTPSPVELGGWGTSRAAPIARTVGVWSTPPFGSRRGAGQ